MAGGSYSFLLVANCFLPLVAGHGWLFDPPSRNSDSNDKSGFCPQCGNGAGICGDGNQFPNDSNFVAFVQEPQRTYVAGQAVQLQVQITAQHMGHHEFFLCDRSISTDDADSYACLQERPLMRVPAEELGLDCTVNDFEHEDCQPIDPNFPGRWYHYTDKPIHRIHYRIPADLQCDQCTLVWFWSTGNSQVFDVASYSCYNELLKSLGWSFNFCGWACTADNCPSNYVPPSNPQYKAPDHRAGSGFEEFRNCADVRVLASGTPTSPPTAMPTAAPTAAVPTATPTTIPTLSPGIPRECVPAINCDSLDWCDAAQLTAYCLEEGQKGACPVRPCQEKAVEPTTAPTTPPMTTPTVAPTGVPTEAPTAAPSVAGSCVANPNLNRGVTDPDCATCPTGYRYWPCNEEQLCMGDCTPPALLQGEQPSSHLRRERRLGRGLSQTTLGASLLQEETNLQEMEDGPSEEL